MASYFTRPGPLEKPDPKYLERQTPRKAETPISDLWKNQTPEKMSPDIGLLEKLDSKYRATIKHKTDAIFQVKNALT